MNTIILENVDRSKTSLFRKLAKALNIDMRVEKEEDIRYRTELLKRVKEYESGKAKIVKLSLTDLKKLVNG